LTTAVHSPLKVEDVRPGSRISRSRAWDALRLKRRRQIGAVELKIPVQGHYFGSSDLDLRAETAPLSSAAFFALGAARGRVAQNRRSAALLRAGTVFETGAGVGDRLEMALCQLS
jgi:hypothetical protein